ncbi:MAG: glycosyltransferase [Rubrivivax sp.]|nr:glycosyltransferase [Rubrivivax sp.]
MIPKVSIVMPCHNARDHLPRSVGSVLAQSFQDWELIAVDDGSVDDTRAWLDAQDDARIQVHGQPNRGVSAARNAGLERACGDYVAFLDADDTWESDFLTEMFAALAGHPDAALAYCGWQNIGLPGGLGDPYIPHDYETPDKEVALFTSCRWPIHAALARRQAVKAAGGFDTGLKNAEDYLLWLRVASHAPIVQVPKVMAYYHFHGNSQASAQAAQAALHHLKAQLRYLQERPQFAAALPRHRVRELTYGKLLARGYQCYWKRDLRNARTIFRAVMREGYGTFPDWLRMLPAWMPESLHKRLLSLRDSG